MTLFPVIPYRFMVMTLTGTAKIDFAETQWDIPAAATVDGSGAAMVQDYISAYGVGFHGQLFTLASVSPEDLHHALLMNATTHHDPSIISFEVIGYVPETNPDAEDDNRWAEEDDDTEEN